MSGTDAGSFTVDSGGQLSLASGVTLDVETKASYSFNITATDKDNETGSIAITLDVHKGETHLAIWCGTINISFDFGTGNWYGCGLVRANIPPVFASDFGSLVLRPHIFPFRGSSIS